MPRYDHSLLALFGLPVAAFAGLIVRRKAP
jgi:hypothetical protein